jgi:hypothetical protein
MVWDIEPQQRANWCCALCVTVLAFASLSIIYQIPDAPNRTDESQLQVHTPKLFKKSISNPMLRVPSSRKLQKISEPRLTVFEPIELLLGACSFPESHQNIHPLEEKIMIERIRLF